MTPTVDEYIAAAMSAFRAERGQRTIHAGGRTMRVHTAGERILHLPNGQQVKVAVDDSGVATQVEEDDALHAIVRPRPIRLRLRMERPEPTVSATIGAHPIAVTTHVTRPTGGH